MFWCCLPFGKWYVSGCSVRSFLSFHSDDSLQRHRLLHTCCRAHLLGVILQLCNLSSYFLPTESRPGLVKAVSPVPQSGQPHRCFSAHISYQSSVIHAYLLESVLDLANCCEGVFLHQENNFSVNHHSCFLWFWVFWCCRAHYCVVSF